MMVIVNDAADAVKLIMDGEKLNQTELADKLGVSRQSVQQALGSKSGNMRVATMRKYLNAMGYELAVVKTGEA